MSAQVAEFETHRPALLGHCYRMLGSSVDADDCVQETLIRAWRKIDQFDARASLRTWLYRIATNVCLDELSDRQRRARPMEEGPAGTSCDTLTQKPKSHWIEPVADARAIPSDANPAEKAILRQSIRLAFVSALQHLPPKQRAAILLAEVLGWPVAEVADALETSVAATNSALQRARATLATRHQGDPSALSDSQTRMLNRYVAAFESYDLDALTSLLKEDATFSMPPYELWLNGPDPVRAWLTGVGSGCKGSRLIPVEACGSPAFAQYRTNPEGGHKAFALIVLELAGERIAGWNSFLDTETLFPQFNLPKELFS